MPEQIWFRVHFLAAPFGGTASTYLLTSWYLCRWATQYDVGDLASYASLGVLLYGMVAIATEQTVSWGGKGMVYAYGEIKRFAREMRERDKARAVQTVANDPELLRQANEAAKERNDTEKAGK